MYINTNDFLETVRTGNVSQIDIEEFISFKTQNHDLTKLKTLLKDLEFYLFVEREELLSGITKEMWTEKHNYYKNKGKEIPYEERPNIMKTLLKGKGKDTANQSDTLKEYNKEKLFFPFEFFCIYQMKNYLVDLINKTQKPINSKHEHIFSNNGFILFDYILNNFVAVNRGRKTDIAFYYWSMFNDIKKFIHQRPESFKEWYNDIYGEDLGKIKTYENITDTNRLRNYSTALDWFKTQ